MPDSRRTQPVHELSGDERPVMLFACTDVDSSEWLQALQNELPDVQFRVWPHGGDLTEVTLALVWNPPRGLLRSLPRLRGVFSLGAGVESILNDPDLPSRIPVVRMVDPALVSSMTEFVLMRVLHYHREMDRYAADQRARIWSPRMARLPQHRSVGLLGSGVLGGACGRALVGLQFDVASWSLGGRIIEGARSFSGLAQLDEFLRRTEILICLLPLTATTDGLLSRDRLAQLPRGAFLINVGRGRHVVDADLIEALDSERLAGVTLDVFREEPLPAQHPFWAHPKITLVPHIAAPTHVKSAAATVAANVRRLWARLPIPDAVDRSRGY